MGRNCSSNFSDLASKLWISEFSLQEGITAVIFQTLQGNCGNLNFHYRKGFSGVIFQALQGNWGNLRSYYRSIAAVIVDVNCEQPLLTLNLGRSHQGPVMKCFFLSKFLSYQYQYFYSIQSLSLIYYLIEVIHNCQDRQLSR